TVKTRGCQDALAGRWWSWDPGTRAGSRYHPSFVLAIVAVPVIAAVCALCVVGLLLIVVTPSRRIRDEARLDQDVQPRLLLGEAPNSIDREVEADTAEHAPVADLHPDD